MIEAILPHFALDASELSVEAFGTGLINNTWVVRSGRKKYILQRINQNVFKDPEAIDGNITAIDHYLKKHFPSYVFTSPVPSKENATLIEEQGNYFRLFKFIEGSHAYTALQNPQLAYEAAKQFGKFTRLLAGFDATQLKTTIPNFHNLSLRYEQFTASLENASPERLAKSKEMVYALQQYYGIVETFEAIKANPAFKTRVTHHDTKISNVLFDEGNRGICVIDLDTVMPGYFISDVGDMMRTYLSPADEEETDLGKIDVREEYFDAIVRGYLSEMRNVLTIEEKQHFVYAGKFMIYMQALRFLADYLNNDVYYGAKYQEHNFNRAANQLRLLNILLQKEPELNKRIETFLKES
jgi:Ser/Thr protein kinase RdoA (MazF antagonist)